MPDNALTSVDPASPAVASTARDADGRYRYRMYVGGAFVDQREPSWIDSHDPVSGDGFSGHQSRFNTRLGFLNVPPNVCNC